MSPWRKPSDGILAQTCCQKQTVTLQKDFELLQAAHKLNRMTRNKKATIRLPKSPLLLSTSLRLNLFKLIHLLFIHSIMLAILDIQVSRLKIRTRREQIVPPSSRWENISPQCICPKRIGMHSRDKDMPQTLYPSSLGVADVHIPVQILGGTSR